MPFRLCSRCHNDLPTEDTGELTFCPHCGAPQIALSEELREQFEQQQLATLQPSDGTAPSTLQLEPAEPQATDPAAVAWPRVLELVALAGSIFTVVMAVTLVVSPLILVVLLWMLGAPIILLGVYCARNPRTRVTTAFGARLGLLSGLTIGSAFFAVSILSIFVQRFVLHRSVELDSQYTTSLEQIRTMGAQLAPSDPAYVQSYLDMLKIPEFHAGMALGGCALLVAIYAVYSTAAGAFSGALRSRSAVK